MIDIIGFEQFALGSTKPKMYALCRTSREKVINMKEEDTMKKRVIDEIMEHANNDIIAALEEHTNKLSDISKYIKNLIEKESCTTVFDIYKEISD